MTRILPLVLLLLLTLNPPLRAAEQGTAHPNIVIILVDDMGYGDPQCFNPKSKIATPSIDSLARDGMRFTDAHSPGSVCHPSRYGLITGRYPFRTTLPWRERPCIDKGRMTIASLARSQGYHTGMVGKWHLGFTNYEKDLPHEGGPVDCGFDSFFGIPASTDIPPYYYIRDRKPVAPPTDHIEANSTPGWSPIQGAFWRAGSIAPGLKLADVLPRFTDEAIQVIKKHHADKTGKPLMLYLAFPSPHTPWLPADEFKGKSGAGLYGDFVMMVDSMVSRVLATLDETGMAKDTMVIFTSDNGPTWYDEDVKRLGHDSAAGLRGMKGDAWEGGHRIPFIVRWPGKVKAGATSAQLVSFTDLLATFADVFDRELPKDAGEDSFSFLPALLGTDAGKQPMRDVLVMASSGGHFVARKGPWKLIDALGSGGFSQPRKVKPGPGDPEGQLYNLADDPAETDNLYLKQAAKVSELQALLKKVRDEGRSRP